VQDLQARIA
jgi:DNA repair exonuclease SbcCD ATPase subunit